MADNIGTLVSAPIRPQSDADTFPTAYADEIKGGRHSVASVSGRNAIPAARRVSGMCVRITNDPDLTNNGDWYLAADLTTWTRERSAMPAESGYLEAWFDAVKTRLGGWTVDGLWDDGAAKRGRRAHREINSNYAVKTPDNRLFNLLTRDGFSGLFQDARRVMHKVSGSYVSLLPLTAIVIAGDSQTQGVSGQYQWWQHLRDMFAASGYTRDFFNLGAGGQDSTQIAARVGARYAYVTVTSNTIPASGSVAVTAMTPAVLTATSPQQMHGAILGVNGMFVRASDGSITFHREVPGSDVTGINNATTQFDKSFYSQATFIQFAGRNTADFEINAVRFDVMAMLQLSKTAIRRNLVMGFTPASTVNPDGSPSGYSSEIIGTSRYTNMRATLDDLAFHLGDRFVDVHTYLNRYGLREAQRLQDEGYFTPFGVSFTPHANDAADVAAGLIPTSLRIDGLHFNTVGHAVIARLVFYRLIALGW